MNIAKPIQIPMTLGQALFTWETLNTHFGDLNHHPHLSDNEKKAIWGLTDLIENALINNGISGNLPNYKNLVKISEQHLKNDVIVEFVD